MKVELIIERKKKFPNGIEPALEAKMRRQLNKKYYICTISARSVRRVGTDELSIFGGLNYDRETVKEILGEKWKSADDWFY
ncbi:DinI-like family protein [Klebsiella aerogenes]|uniref:DinI-like family protein n=1 Tax=Klebsiella aerogenes TaxID=548 RepID=UPI001C8B34C0|nr:DinI-like family protein [Klebsiella aerogenes]MBX8998410.1 DinI-like family protein [Klebsiella aerogenes]HCB0663398.1 DinI-like family protein [Klebsiella pneumoniae]